MGKHDMADFYHKTGCCRTVAQSEYFAFFMIVCVFLYSVWIGVSEDLNSHGKWVHVSIEYTFCFIFSLELAVRFLACRAKGLLLLDSSFLLDTVVVALMVLDVFVIPLVSLWDGSGMLNYIHVLRLVRLTRLARMAHVLRLLPELRMMLKGVMHAMRFVLTTLIMQLVLVYIFGILFKMWSETIPVLAEGHFSSVPTSMLTLLLGGTLMDNIFDMTNQLIEHSSFLATLYIIFVFMSPLLVMNMLVGVVVDTVAKVSAKEKEDSEQRILRTSLQELLAATNRNDDGMLTESEWVVVFRDPEFKEILERFSVAAAELHQVVSERFFDLKAQMKGLMRRTGSGTAAMTGNISHAEFLEMVMMLRGGNYAVRTDVVKAQSLLSKRLEYLEDHLDSLVRASTSPIWRGVKCKL